MQHLRGCVSLLLFSAAAVFAQGNGKYLPPNHINPKFLSQGAQAWWFGVTPLQGFQSSVDQELSKRAGKNVDANNPAYDLAPGQSETALAASGALVMAAWNDATGFVVTSSTSQQGSGTGVGISRNGAQSFTDLIGLPNNNPNAKWSGDPSVVAVDNGNFFLVSSIYTATFPTDCSLGPAPLAIAVSVATVTPTAVEFGNPVIVATGGDACGTETAFLDKDFMTYDPITRTVAISYTRFTFYGLGTGQIEVVTAHVPSSPPFLSASNFSQPIVVWPEEVNVENEGAYPALAYNPAANADDIYVTWERNWGTNTFNGDPYVYVYISEIQAGTTPPHIIGVPGNPIVVTLNQANSTATGGVKSLDLVPIPGYNRGTANDYPRIAYNPVSNNILITWNDASTHPLGDIFLRSYAPGLVSPSAIQKVNDDNSGALHLFPSICVKQNGSIATSWFDRRNYGPDSSITDYFAENRSSVTSNGTDFAVTTAPTDWLGVASYIVPNFGDYTDNTCTGNIVYYNWSDGRIGVPQPYVARN